MSLERVDPSYFHIVITKVAGLNAACGRLDHGDSITMAHLQTYQRLDNVMFCGELVSEDSQIRFADPATEEDISSFVKCEQCLKNWNMGLMRTDLTIAKALGYVTRAHD